MGLIVFAVSSYLQQDMVTGKAPILMGVDIQGNHVQLPAITPHNRAPTLIYFWGSWCPVCRVTSPMVESVSQEYPVVSVAVASGEDIDIQTYMQQQGYTFTVLNDVNGHWSQQWGALAFPAIYIIDAKGQIRFITSGATTSIGMKLRLWLAQF